jgi:AcrR family transcriptional regulator
MTRNKTTAKLDTSTEEKIKEAARKVFHQKGYAATRTRDIAEEAEINLALLNYYFRSKEKLFNIIMIETLTGFVRNMTTVLNNEETTLGQKVELIASNYIDLIIKEPEVPTFIVSEIRNNPNMLLQKMPVKQLMIQSVFFKQHQEAVKRGEITEPNPLHFLMTLIGLIVFPFIAKPLLMGGGEISTEVFHQLMLERKTHIPVWVKAMMKAGTKAKKHTIDDE